MRWTTLHQGGLQYQVCKKKNIFVLFSYYKWTNTRTFESSDFPFKFVLWPHSYPWTFKTMTFQNSFFYHDMCCVLHLLFCCVLNNRVYFCIVLHFEPVFPNSMNVHLSLLNLTVPERQLCVLRLFISDHSHMQNKLSLLSGYKNNLLLVSRKMVWFSCYLCIWLLSEEECLM